MDPPPQGNRRPWIIGGAFAAAAIVLVLVVTAFAGNDDGSGGDSSSGQRAAVEKLLEANENQDLEAMKAALCEKDLASENYHGLDYMHVTSYEIDGVEQHDDVYAVTVTVQFTSLDDTTAQPDSSRAAFPVLRENGTWKVCDPGDNDEGTAVTTNTNVTTEGDSSSTSSVTDTGTCFADQSSPDSVSATYAVEAESQDTDDAQACVYHDSVPESVADQIPGHHWILSAHRGFV